MKATHLLFAAALAIVLASCTKEDPLKPAINVKPGDWHEISSSGGTIEEEDIILDFPSGTFDGTGKVALSKIPKGTLLGQNEKSQFYQVMLPKDGTKKPFTIRIKRGEGLDGCDVVAQSAGFVRRTGEVITSTRAVPATYSDGEMVVDVPVFSGAMDSDPFFSIGLVESFLTDAPETKGEVRNSQYSLTWPIYKTFSTWNDYKGTNRTKILDFLNQNIPLAHKELKNLNFKWPSGPIAYQIEEFEGSDANTWGQEVIDWLFSNFGSWATYVRVNARLMLKLVTSDPASNTYLDYSGNLQQTMIHETFHYIHDEVYDPRFAITKSVKGKTGDEWAMLSDAIACWTEKKAGNKLLSENTYIYADNLLRSFLPEEQTELGYRHSGYAMALFTEWIAQKSSDGKIYKVLEYQNKGAASVVDAYKSLLQECKIDFFSPAGYRSFINDIVSGKVDKKVNLETIFPTKVKGTNSATKLTFQDDVYSFGISVDRVKFLGNVLDDNKSSDVSISQDNEGLTTLVYYSNSGTPVLLGQTDAHTPLSIPIADCISKSVKELTFITLKDSQDFAEPSIRSKISFEIIKQDKSIPHIWSVGLDGDITIKGKDCWINAGWSEGSISAINVKKVSKGFEVTAYDFKKDTYEVTFTITTKGNGFGDVVDLRFTCYYNPDHSFSLDKLTLQHYDSGIDASHGDASWKEKVPGGAINLDVYFKSRR